MKRGAYLRARRREAKYGGIIAELFWLDEGSVLGLGLYSRWKRAGSIVARHETKHIEGISPKEQRLRRRRSPSVALREQIYSEDWEREFYRHLPATG